MADPTITIRGNTADVDLWYPRTSPVKYVQVGLVDVRAADDIRISYDFKRDGWSIEQAAIFSWSIDDPVCDPEWKEVAFMEAWAREVKTPMTDHTAVPPVPPGGVPAPEPPTWSEWTHERVEERIKRDIYQVHTTMVLLAEALAVREGELQAIGLQACDKCKKRVPRNMIAIEVQDGHPIDDPAGFMWCIVCHSRRVLEAREGELARVKTQLEALRSVDGTKNGR